MGRMPIRHTGKMPVPHGGIFVDKYESNGETWEMISD